MGGFGDRIAANILQGVGAFTACARGRRFVTINAMGYKDENGEFRFEWGFGKGVEGMPYKATDPQGQFGPMTSGNKTRHGGVLPYWTRDRQRRLHVLVEYFERRAKFKGLMKVRETPADDLAERLEIISTILESARQAEMLRLKKKKSDAYRLRHLQSTGPYTDWVAAVLHDYYFEAADDATEMTQSWDAGQCAYRHGGIKKIFVKQLIRAVDKLGNELYPSPPDAVAPTVSETPVPLPTERYPFEPES